MYSPSGEIGNVQNRRVTGVEKFNWLIFFCRKQLVSSHDIILPKGKVIWLEYENI